MKIKLIIILVSAILATRSFAADWPQFRGPDRDGKSAETGLLKKWPKEGPELLWSVDGLGEGYTSAAISEGAVYITGLIDKLGYVFSYDLDGNLKNKASYGPEWNRSYKATRSTPTVVGKRLYLFSGNGVAYCMDAASLKTIWSVDVVKKFEAVFPMWGMAENLLVDGDNVICTPGGARGSVVALDRMTGDVVWVCSELTQQSAYCSPRAIQVGSKRLIVTELKDSAVGLDAETGKFIWKDDFDDYHSDRERAISPNVPLYHEGYLHITSGYDNGGALLALSDDGIGKVRVWTDETLDVHHGGVVLIDGYLYGANWKDNRSGDWACIKWTDRKAMYDTKWNGNKGSVVYADGMLYCYDETDGDLALVPATPEGFKPVSSFEITLGEGKFWAHPSISDGRLYIRHGEYLMVYDIKQR